MSVCHSFIYEVCKLQPENMIYNLNLEERILNKTQCIAVHLLRYSERNIKTNLDINSLNSNKMQSCNHLHDCMIFLKTPFKILHFDALHLRSYYNSQFLGESSIVGDLSWLEFKELQEQRWLDQARAIVFSL